jgi:hypothetical protein
MEGKPAMTDRSPVPARLARRTYGVTLAGTEPPLARPVLPVRPPLSRSVHAVATLIGVCEPEGIPAIRRAVARLWRDDLVYAERRYRLRAG